MNDQRNDRQQKQNVDREAGDVHCCKPEEPQGQQNHEENDKHRKTPFLKLLLNILTAAGRVRYCKDSRMLADLVKSEVSRYVANATFTSAVLYFKDGSSLQFVHSSRSNRSARASEDDTTAEKICRSLRQFRLNAKHLQLFFEDGSDAEFFTVV
jgi:hypothetical protein